MNTFSVLILIVIVAIFSRSLLGVFLFIQKIKRENVSNYFRGVK